MSFDCFILTINFFSFFIEVLYKKLRRVIMVMSAIPKLVLIIVLFAAGTVQANGQLPIGQLLFIGVQGTEFNPHLQGLLEEIQPGGIILFKRNILSAEQISTFNNDIIRLFVKDQSMIPLLAIDQEGGGVYRVPTDPLLPSAAALGRTKSARLIRNYGKIIGRILRELKFTMNLAPVLDLRLKESDFIGSRSFGKNPKEVSSSGILFAKGLLEQGVLPTGKHFPGVGGLKLDPHSETPTADLDWAKSWDKELFPFREFSTLYPSALLLSHVVYPKMDSKLRPASFSENIIQKGLREKIKFRGLVITDDLMMEGAKKQANPSKSAIESLKAGADMIMVTWSESLQKKLVKEIDNAIQNGILDYDSIRQKIERIKQVKKLLINDDYLNVKQKEISFRSQELEALNSDLLEEILEQDNFNTIELKRNIEEIPLLIVDAPVKLHRDILATRNPKLTEFFNLNKTDDWQNIRKRLNKNKQAMVMLFIRNGKAIGNLDWFKDEEKKRMIIVNMQIVSLDDKDKYAGVYSPFWSFRNFYSTLELVLRKKNPTKISRFSN
jgi:beta-N-acetylhexosaminidase